MAFTATEGTTAPIILGKEPVPKPFIPRGRTSIFSSAVLAFNEERQTVSYTARLSGYVLTYHDAIVRSGDGDVLRVEIGPDVLVTWERLTG